MISISVGEILRGWDEGHIDARIYMVRDDSLVFYAGVLERSILDHLLEHFGVVVGGPPADRLGRLMLDNTPSSNGWVVDLLSLADCEPIVREVQPMIRRVDVARALICLVNYYRPCLVEKDNPDPMELPERYKGIL
jgi:hypothetical protein